jgi:hypothetical protein
MNLSSIILLVVATAAQAIDTVPEQPKWSPEEIAAIVERAKSDPSVLWELKDAPIDKTYKPLWRLWGNGEESHKQRMNSRRYGTEKEWIASEKRSGSDYETAERLFPVARDVLLSQPNLEAYITVCLQRQNDRQTTYAKTGDYPPFDPAYDPNMDFKSLLFFVEKVPGDAAIRMAGSFLSSPHWPRQDHGDYVEYSPASWARGTLAKLVKERFGEEIPKDVEEARTWWAQNQHRFALKPKSNAETRPATPSPSTAVAPKQTAAPLPAAAVAATPVTEHQTNLWLLAAAGGLLLAFGAGLLLRKRCDRT